jgi:hypothetical protein
MFSKKIGLKSPIRAYKQSFLLIEILIAASLAFFLMAAASGLYYACQKTTKGYEKNIDLSTQLASRITKLRSILRYISIIKNEEVLFFVENEQKGDHLYFTADLGPRYEGICKNEKYGQLYVNEENNLIFVWSKPGSKMLERIKEEEGSIIWPGVTSISFCCVMSPSDSSEIQPPVDKDGLINPWKREWKKLPVAIVVNLELEKETIQVSSILPSSLQPIEVS